MRYTDGEDRRVSRRKAQAVARPFREVLQGARRQRGFCCGQQGVCYSLHFTSLSFSICLLLLNCSIRGSIMIEWVQVLYCLYCSSVHMYSTIRVTRRVFVRMCSRNERCCICVWAQLTYADLSFLDLWDRLELVIPQLKLGELLTSDAYPTLVAHRAHIAAIPNVKKWLDTRPASEFWNTHCLLHNFNYLWNWIAKTFTLFHNFEPFHI